MKRDLKAMIKLGLFLAMADFDAAKKELETLAGLAKYLADKNPTVINSQDITSKAFLEITEESLAEFMKIMNLAEDKEVFSQEMLKAISQEAQHITDMQLRELTLKFCCVIAFADKDFKDIEFSVIKLIHQYWVGRSDGWNKDLNVHLKRVGISIQQ